MNVYDCANDLAKAIRESHEMAKLKEAKEAIKKDADAEKLVKEFMQLSQEVELSKYQGGVPDEEKADKLQKVYNLIALKKPAMEYLNAFMRFQLMMADVSKAISEPVNEVIGEEK